MPSPPVLRAALSGPAVVLAAGILAAMGCDSQPPRPEPAARSAQAAPRTGQAAPPSLREEAEQLFSSRCQTCHGPQGAGDGPGAAALSPRPRNFQDPAFQQSVSDEHIANVIQFGGAAVGKSPTMPGNPDLGGRPDLVKELVAVVRRLGDG